jgi:hypothetical protein
MGDQLEGFVALSSLLTGFSAVQLRGSGVAEQHLSVLNDVLGTHVVRDLLDAFEKLPDGDGRESAVAVTILGDARLGPVARNVILLWYSGVWTQLPAAWREAFGASPLDTTRTTSGDAYRSGLQWVVAGAHAPGANHQGFGSWALEPKRRRA